MKLFKTYLLLFVFFVASVNAQNKERIFKSFSKKEAHFEVVTNYGL